ncbi:MAG: chromophore lyase CpcT/CpeT [Saprospiraceae bacterium]|nr:chromophore lyase CpcT/CpeT [Saprospiraceae bacterium]MBK7812424.1 chromophore lyase CpcT/CpeT [Saprospiraceae bacterium]MBK9632351.1 chromophore lyase CpcT/CpeT [Saprospiraceae bacterium]
MSWKGILFLCVGSLFMACAPAKKASHFSQDIIDLRNLMVGTFSSYLQASQDSNFLSIQLQMCPIWLEDKYGVWLYVEQAASDQLHKPYRQRVYKLERLSKNHYISKVYTLPDEKNFVRYCHKPFSNFPLKQDQLILKEGCTVYLEKIGEFHFKGSTKNNNCESKLRGASSVRSEVEITKEGLKTLDRGFTKNGLQVWGSENGLYLFLKLPTE